MLPFLLIIVVFYFPAHPSPAEKTENLAADARQSQKPGIGSRPPAAFAASLLPSKTTAIQLRIPPDNLRMKWSRAPIASVTQDEAK